MGREGARNRNIGGLLTRLSTGRGQFVIGRELNASGRSTVAFVIISCSAYGPRRLSKKGNLCGAAKPIFRNPGVCLQASQTSESKESLSPET